MPEANHSPFAAPSDFSRWILLFCALLLALSPALARTKKKLPAHPFDLNTATLKQLEELPGVGPVTAHAILDFREKSGPFKSVNDLLVIPRISKKRLEKIRPYVFVRTASAPKKHARFFRHPRLPAQKPVVTRPFTSSF